MAKSSIAAPIYLRFVTERADGETGLKSGIFSEAYGLLDGTALSAVHHDLLSKLIAWFDDRLPVPERFNSSKSKGASRRNSHGISWIKPEAEEHISRMREIAWILEEHGIKVVMIKTQRPGRIVYEDEWQIVAEPFADTRA